MLRSLVLILLIVNAAFYAWSHGWLNQIVGVRPDAQHEPQRLQQQLHADQIMLASSGGPASSPATPSTPASEAASPPSSLPGSTSSGASGTEASPGTPPDGPSLCIEAGPFNSSELAAVEGALKPLLPAGSWANRTVAIQGLWLVYMGPYPDPETLAHKQAELRRIKGLNFEEVRTPANLAQGLSLGRYNRAEDAQAALAGLRNRGIRTARVVNIRPDMELQIVQVPHANVQTQVNLSALKLPQGKGFTACR